MVGVMEMTDKVEVNEMHQVSGEEDHLSIHEKIELIMSEYDMIRSETRMFFNLQFTVIGIWITLSGILIGFVLNDLSSFTINDEMTAMNIILIKFILSILLPGSSGFLGVIWLDFSYRIARNSYYTYQIEDKVKSMINTKVELLGWEHFIKSDGLKMAPVKWIDYFYYFAVMGVIFIVVPLICLYLVTVYFGEMIESIYFVLFVLIEIIIIFFVCVYVKRILLYTQH